MKLPIISEDAGAKIACGRGTGNYYIISDGLIRNPVMSYNYRSIVLYFPLLSACAYISTGRKPVLNCNA